MNAIKVLMVNGELLPIGTKSIIVPNEFHVVVVEKPGGHSHNRPHISINKIAGLNGPPGFGEFVLGRFPQMGDNNDINDPYFSQVIMGDEQVVNFLNEITEKFDCSSLSFYHMMEKKPTSGIKISVEI